MKAEATVDNALDPDDPRLREDEEPTQQKISSEADKSRNDFADYCRNARSDEANGQAIIDKPHEHSVAPF